MKRIVLKIGSSTLTQGTNRISRGKMEDIATQIKNLSSNHEIILVSSGAIAAAKQFIALDNTDQLTEKQALAAIGQVHLMRMYHEVFRDYGLHVSQCLFTHYDFSNQTSSDNILNTIDTLLRFRYVPIINENDTVSTEEIKFGDNDKLAALTAVLVKADLLVLATDTDGVFDKDPKMYQEAAIQTDITNLDEIMPFIGQSKSSLGSGGMKSKIEAAAIAQQAGIETWILNGQQNDFLTSAMRGERLFTRVLG